MKCSECMKRYAKTGKARRIAKKHAKQIPLDFTKGTKMAKKTKAPKTAPVPKVLTPRLWLRTFRSQSDETIVVIENDTEGMYYRMPDRGATHEFRMDIAIDCARAGWKNRALYTDPGEWHPNEMAVASAVAHRFACWIGFWRKA